VPNLSGLKTLTLDCLLLLTSLILSAALGHQMRFNNKLVYVIIGIIVFLDFLGFLDFLYSFPSADYRPRFFSLEPGKGAVSLVALVTLILDKDKASFKVYLVMILLFILVIGAKGALLAFIVSLFMMLKFQQRLGLLITLTAFVVGLWNNILWFSEGSTSYGTRIILNSHAVLSLLSNPFGYSDFGWENYLAGIDPSSLNWEIKEYIKTSSGLYPKSALFGWLVRYGILGLVLFISLFKSKPKYKITLFYKYFLAINLMFFVNIETIFICLLPIFSTRYENSIR
jgi:hypothetical protein